MRPESSFEEIVSVRKQKIRISVFWGKEGDYEIWLKNENMGKIPFLIGEIKFLKNRPYEWFGWEDCRFYYISHIAGAGKKRSIEGCIGICEKIHSQLSKLN